MRPILFSLFIIVISNSHSYKYKDVDLLSRIGKSPNLLIKSKEQENQILNKFRYNEHLSKTNDIAEAPRVPAIEFIDIPQYNNNTSVVNKNFRRKGKSSGSSSDSSDLSSSLDEEFWQNEWNEHWAMKKHEALNYSDALGDTVNMVAARPWGVPCGDPYQHDVPWGSCTLAAECDGEFRIYRGDHFCGRTSFVCCSIQVANYDMYQGIEQSFEDTSLSTDTEERKDRLKTSKERKRKRARKNRRKRIRKRKRRTRKIKKHIKKIAREIKRMLNKKYSNATKSRKRQTKWMKKFIKNLKDRLKKERKQVQKIHSEEVKKIDNNVMKQLNDVKVVNKKFLSNATYRDIIINGTVNTEALRMLVKAFPDLTELLTRRSAPLQVPLEESQEQEDDLHYDIEFGELYY